MAISIYRRKRTDTEGYENESFRVSNALMDNLIRRPDSITQSEIIEGDYSTAYTDEHGKEFVLSAIQFRLVMSFAKYIDGKRKEEKTKQYIEQISIPEQFNYLTKLMNQGKQFSTPICYTFSPRELTEMAYESCGGKQMERVRQEIESLSRTKQKMVYTLKKGGEAKTVGRRTTLLKVIDWDYKEEDRNGESKAISLIQIQFDDFFVLDILRRYTLVPSSVLPKLKEKGVQTEMFITLFSLLLRRRGSYVKKAMKASAQKRAELRKGKHDPHKIEEEAESFFQACLTHKETIGSILERMGDNSKYVYKTGTRKGKLRTDRIRQHFDRAVQSLISIGIIKKYSEKKAPSIENIVCSFTFNEEWIKESKDETQNLISRSDDSED